MLTEAEKNEILAELPQYEQKRGACIEALKIVQEQRRWISDESVADIAEMLEMTPSEVDSVATYYNLVFRRPVGRHVILICDSISCWIMGYEKMLDHLKKKLGVQLGGTTEDGAFTLLPICCLGTCDHAPALMIDHETYRDLDEPKLDRLLEEYRNK